MRALEQRILLDAALGETVEDVTNQAVHGELAQTYRETKDTNAGHNANWAAAVALRDQDGASSSETDINQAQPSQIAFIAADVPDMETLLAGLPSAVEIIVQENGSDGMDQI
ncbi:MAG: LEPR-XLL domain-containing protein, partial [Pseudomonadota bacterium]